MEIRVYRPDLRRVGQIENQTSVQWTRRYFAPGEMEIHAPITPKNLELLAEGNLIGLPDSAEAAVIEDIEKEESDIKNEITVKGRFLSSYMDRRTIKTVFNYSGRIEDAIRALYAQVVPLPLVILAPDIGSTATIDFQASFKNLDIIVEKLARQGLLGIRFRPDYLNRQIIFEIYQGKDRSVSQGANGRVIFSESYNNLTNAIYKYNNQLYKTKAIVGGEGEGLDRVIVEVGEGEGLDLREMFVDARDLSSEGLTTEQYKAALRQRGLDALTEAAKAESLEAEVDPNINFSYKTDWDLGDIVTVKKKKWGYYMDQRVTEVKEVYEYGGGYVVPTFGSPLPEKIDWSDK